MEENTTSPGGSATPTPETPATGTPTASQGAMPQKPALTLEEALKRNAELEHSHNNAKEELERHRKKLSAFERAEKEAEAAKKAAEEAERSEIERVKKQHADLQARHEAHVRATHERIVRYEVERQAARLNIIDPEAAAKLLDWSELEYDEDGTPKNAEKLLEKLVKNKPYLAPAQAATPQPTPASPAVQRQPTLPAMNPGRSSIAAPGSVPAGKPVRLTDVWSR